MMQAVETQQAEETEQQLIDMAAAAVRQSNWTIGEAASKWTERYSAGRTDADFAELIGSSQSAVNRARNVYGRFYARVHKHDFAWRDWLVVVTWDDADTCLDWAEDTEATFREMEAWRRARNGEPLKPDPVKAPTQQAAEPEPPIVVPGESSLQVPRKSPQVPVKGVESESEPTGQDQSLRGEIRDKPATNQTQTPDGLTAGSRYAIKSLRTLAKRANQAERQSVAKSLRRLADEFDPPTQTEAVGIPANLVQSEAFRTAWKEWNDYRKQKRQKLIPSTASKQLAKLSAMGAADAVRSINHSIEQGWTGLFSPDGADSGGNVSARVHNKDLSKEVVYRDFD